MIALAERENDLASFMNYRITSGELSGVNSGNLFIDSLIKLHNGNLSEAIDWANIEESESEKIEAGVGVNKKIRLPYVNLSQTEKYIVTYKINIEMPNKSIREVIVNYQVKNNLEICITEEYKSKTIAVVMQYPMVDFIDLFDGDLKFMVGNYVAIKTENKTYYFEVFDGGTTPYIELYSPLESVGGETLEDITLFKNSLDFDMQIIDKTSKSVIYESADWKLIPEIQIEAKNSKALSDIFSKVELGDELQDKQFVKVVNAVDSLNSLSVSDISKLGSGFNGNYNGEGNKFKLEKTITRGAQEYKIQL